MAMANADQLTYMIALCLNRTLVKAATEDYAALARSILFILVIDTPSIE